MNTSGHLSSAWLDRSTSGFSIQTQERLLVDLELGDRTRIRPLDNDYHFIRRLKRRWSRKLTNSRKVPCQLLKCTTNLTIVLVLLSKSKFFSFQLPQQSIIPPWSDRSSPNIRVPPKILLFGTTIIVIKISRFLHYPPISCCLKLRPLSGRDDQRFWLCVCIGLL